MKNFYYLALCFLFIEKYSYTNDGKEDSFVKSCIFLGQSIDSYSSPIDVTKQKELASNFKNLMIVKPEEKEETSKAMCKYLKYIYFDSFDVLKPFIIESLMNDFLEVGDILIDKIFNISNNKQMYCDRVRIIAGVIMWLEKDQTLVEKKIIDKTVLLFLICSLKKINLEDLLIDNEKLIGLIATAYQQGYWGVYNIISHFLINIPLMSKNGMRELSMTEHLDLITLLGLDIIQSLDSKIFYDNIIRGAEIRGYI